MATRGEVRVSDSPEELAVSTAEWLCTILDEAGAGPLAVNLSGGSTPKRLYEALATDRFRSRIPWDRVHWFWGDERFVPPDDDMSNYRMANLALLAVAPVPPGNIHPIPTVDVTPEEAAAQYEQTLRGWREGRQYLFDVTLLGLGTNGHTASLMPGSDALNEMERWAAPVRYDPPGYRITLTYPALADSRHSAFLIAGSDKHEMYERARRGDESIPAGRIAPRGDLYWFVDKAAAA